MVAGGVLLELPGVGVVELECAGVDVGLSDTTVSVGSLSSVPDDVSPVVADAVSVVSGDPLSVGVATLSEQAVNDNKSRAIISHIVYFIALSSDLYL